jgi:site-specific recombinase XerD
MNITAEVIGLPAFADLANATNGDPWGPVSGSVIARFLDFIWLKHGLSQPTLNAYLADLHALDRWLLLNKQRTVVQASAEDVREFLLDRGPQGQSAQSPTPSLACIKRFYGFLLEGRFRADDPTENVFVRAPRLVRHDLAVVRASK